MLTQRFAYRFEIVVSTQRTVNSAIVGYGVTSVILAFARLHDLHQVNIACPQLLQIVDVQIAVTIDGSQTVIEILEPSFQSKAEQLLITLRQFVQNLLDLPGAGVQE